MANELNTNDALNKDGTELIDKLVGINRVAKVVKGGRRFVFDRGGYKYHGRVKALAEAARSAGLKF